MNAAFEVNPFPRRMHDRVQANYPLASLTTLRIGGPAQWFVRAQTLRDVADTVLISRERGLPLRVLGGGSNLLIADEGVSGIVLSLHGMKQLRMFGHHVQVQAGASLAGLVARCAASGIAGPEGLAGIPGNVGGALAMNAGGRYAEIADFVERVVWINPDGEVESLYREEIDFAYRISSLRAGVIIEAVLKGVPGDREKLLARSREIMAEKLAVQPYSEFSAGCAFKNPKGESAGRLIDQAGCKGLSIGGAKVSDRHGNFFVNSGNARASELRALLQQVQQRVAEVHGITLQTEIQIWPPAKAA